MQWHKSALTSISGIKSKKSLVTGAMKQESRFDSRQGPTVLCFTIASTFGHTQPIKCIQKELSPGTNQCGLEDDHSYPVPRPRLDGAIQPPSPYILMAWCLTLNIPSLAHQRCLSSWGPRRTPWFFL